MKDLTWDGAATLIAAGSAAVVVVVGYFVQQAISRAAKRSEMYARAMQAVEDYVEGPYVVARRDGSSSARLSITRHLSEVQSRLRYFESALAQDAPTALSSAYTALVEAARLEAGGQMKAAWKAKPTRRDREVPLVKAIPQPRIDDAKATVIALMAPGARAFGRGAFGVISGLGVIPLLLFLALNSVVGMPWGALGASLCASITLGTCLAFVAYYWSHIRPRNIAIVFASISAAMTVFYWGLFFRV